MKNPLEIPNFDYYFEKEMEAGVVLEGWEVKSIRKHKVQLTWKK